MLRSRVENAVASTSLGDGLDPSSIALGLDGAEDDPEQFPDHIHRLKQPKTAPLLFRSGKVVGTGARRTADRQTAVLQIAKMLQGAGLLR